MTVATGTWLFACVSALADVVLGCQCVPGFAHPSSYGILLLLCGIQNQGAGQREVWGGNGQCGVVTISETSALLEEWKSWLQWWWWTPSGPSWSYPILQVWILAASTSVWRGMEHHIVNTIKLLPWKPCLYYYMHCAVCLFCGCTIVSLQVSASQEGGKNCCHSALLLT